MSKLAKRIDFVALISVENANPNGDPLLQNTPRTDSDGYGEISDVCIKRKIRNRMQDLGYQIFIQSPERAGYDGEKSLDSRYKAAFKSAGKADIEETKKAACEKWLDVRSFGQVFAFDGQDDSGDKKSKGKGDGVSISVTGPVSIRIARSVSIPIITSMQITKSVNGKISKNGGKSKDTMGMKNFIRFGLYRIEGSIGVQQAERTGFSEEDADVIKKCLKTLFENDATAARPAGSMNVERLFWYENTCPLGDVPVRNVFRSIDVHLKDENNTDPHSVDDYDVTINEFPIAKDGKTGKMQDIPIL